MRIDRSGKIVKCRRDIMAIGKGKEGDLDSISIPNVAEVGLRNVRQAIDNVRAEQGECHNDSQGFVR